ncbi:MSCRAMM family adhesin SdrC, partial [Pseudomonas lundensis]|uniref:MSCRAMM family adhesin SdrC n=1 Tax=Pseudomonas lundensis TaxID=86185 RepID=UPI001D0108BD
MNAIQKSIPYIARVLSDSTGVQVVFGASRPYTDGRKIFVPMVESTPLAASLTLGFVTHESAHCRFSDFSDDAFSKDKFTNALAGIVEDLWIERKMLIEFPGARRHIDTVVEKVFGTKKLDDLVSRKKQDSFHNFVLLFGRARVLLQQIEVDDLAVKFDEIFGAGLSQAVLDVLMKTHLSESSKENLCLALELVKLYQGAVAVESSTNSTSQPSTAANADEQADAQPDANANGQADAEPDANPNGQADAEPVANADGQADAQPDANANGQADAQPDANADRQADAQPDANANGQADAEPVANADGQAD